MVEWIDLLHHTKIQALDSSGCLTAVHGVSMEIMETDGPYIHQNSHQLNIQMMSPQETSLGITDGHRHTELLEQWAPSARAVVEGETEQAQGSGS